MDSWKQDWGTILDWIRHLGRTSSQAIMSGNGMLGYARSLTQHELSMSLLSLSPAIDVRSQTHSRQDVAPILVGTMTMHRRIQPEPQAQAPAANSNSPRAWCTPRAGHSRSPSRKVRALVLPPRAAARLDVVAAPVFLPWDWDCGGCGGEGTAQRHESEPLAVVTKEPGSRGKKNKMTLTSRPVCASAQRRAKTKSVLLLLE